MGLGFGVDSVAGGACRFETSDGEAGRETIGLRGSRSQTHKGDSQMDISTSVFADTRDFLKYEVRQALGVRLWAGRFPLELRSGWLPSARRGTDAPFRIVVSTSDLRDEFLYGDQAWLEWKPGYPADGPAPIDLRATSLEGFREWLEEVKAEAQRWL